MSTKTLIEEIQELKEMIVNLASQQKEYLNIKEASNYLSISESTIYKLTSSKSIPYHQPNGKIILFKRQDLENYIEKGRKRTYDELCAEGKSMSNKLKK